MCYSLNPSSLPSLSLPAPLSLSLSLSLSLPPLSPAVPLSLSPALPLSHLLSRPITQQRGDEDLNPKPKP